MPESAPIPIETAAQVHRLPAVDIAYAAADASGRQGGLTGQSHKILCSAVTAAGIEIGAHDHRVITWLAGYGPEICAVLASLITRAAAAEQSRILRLADTFECPCGDPDCTDGADALGALGALIADGRT